MRRGAATFAICAALTLSCKKGASTADPEPETHGAQDAASLPAFDIDSGQPPVSEAGVPYERFHVEIGDAPLRGPAAAPVTVVMFSDFECPYCLRGHRTLKELEHRYNGQIRIAYKAFPLDFHENAFAAALAARSAQEQGKFWDFHDLMFSRPGLDRATILDHARTAGLDVDVVRGHMDSLEYAPLIARDMRQARRMGVGSTPTFFINGRLIKGAQPLGDFVQVVDQELALAEKWRKAGVATDGLYEHAIADGYRRVEYRGRRSLDPDGVYPVPVGDSPARGPADAPVTVVVFGDFECPYCARGNRTLQQVETRYEGRIRVVYKHQPLPFHSHAFVAARASMAAHDQGKFWEFHDALYELDAKFDEDALTKIARKIGLNLKKFRKSMDSTELDAKISADQQLALALGVRGTPAYFINGRPISGAQPEISFRLVIEEELHRARKLTDEGVPADKLYDELTRRPLD